MTAVSQSDAGLLLCSMRHAANVGHFGCSSRLAGRLPCREWLLALTAVRGLGLACTKLTPLAWIPGNLIMTDKLKDVK